MIERRLGHGIVKSVFASPVLDIVERDPSLPMKIYIPWCLHVPTTNPATGTDGYGNTVTGTAEPLLDTIISIKNPKSQPQLTAIVQVFNSSGVVQNWDGSPSKQIILSPDHSIAFTFIPGNPFSDCPTNFQGYAIVQLSHVAAVGAGVGGGGYWPAYWNTIAGSIPVFADAPVTGYNFQTLKSRSQFTFPYWIIWSDNFDLNHYQHNAYRTYLVITNVDAQDCYAHISSTIGDAYSGAGTVYSAPQLVQAGRSQAIDLYAFLKANAGYPATESGNEGGLEITLRATANPADPTVNRLVLPHMLVCNRDVINPQSYQPNEKLQFGLNFQFI